MSDFVLTRHAIEEMERRGIDPAAVEGVLARPEQIVSGHGGLRVYQSSIVDGGKAYLLRVIVNDARHPMRVVTVYRTSKISKYRGAE